MSNDNSLVPHLHALLIQVTQNLRMAINFSSNCLRCICRSALTKPLFSKHSSQQLLSMVLALVRFLTLLTSMAICAFLLLSFFFCSGSYFTELLGAMFLKRESTCPTSSSMASLAILMVILSSGSCSKGISEESCAILSIKQMLIRSFFQEQNSTNLRYSSISLVRFALFFCLRQLYSWPRMPQMNYSVRLFLPFQVRGGVVAFIFSHLGFIQVDFIINYGGVFLACVGPIQTGYCRQCYCLFPCFGQLQ